MPWEYFLLCCICRNNILVLCVFLFRVRETKRMSSNGEGKREVVCCWQLLAVSEQPAETGTLRLQRHLQLKQTGVMQEPLKQTLLLFKMETPSEGP